ncbi:uncharacterized protein [Periplaneta americana]|uniref:uncharacterized protein n=1 Tax=Periplaneta americana TaxID=6978 RepID=UPI0037E874E9
MELQVRDVEMESVGGMKAGNGSTPRKTLFKICFVRHICHHDQAGDRTRAAWMKHQRISADLLIQLSYEDTKMKVQELNGLRALEIPSRNEDPPEEPAEFVEKEGGCMEILRSIRRAWIRKRERDAQRKKEKKRLMEGDDQLLQHRTMRT